jgi:hypothetical protein
LQHVADGLFKLLATLRDDITEFVAKGFVHKCEGSDCLSFAGDFHF